MPGLVGYATDCGNSFIADRGLYSVEMMQNGWARVQDRRSGETSLIDPDDGWVYTGPPIPAYLAAEITRRWGAR